MKINYERKNKFCEFQNPKPFENKPIATQNDDTTQEYMSVRF